MRFTSLIVELIRVRPALMVWVAVLAQALLWFVVPTVLYSSPPGDLAMNLSYGREYMMGSAHEPPLAFWLTDIAFRFAGNHIFGIYLLSQLCFIVAFWAIFRLGSAIVGGQQAAVAVLLTATVTAFAFPQIEFGPHILAQPLWALTLLSGWRVIGEGRRSAWFSLSIYAGLLLLSTNAAPALLALLAVFALATARGRRMLASFDLVLAIVVVAVLVVPYAVYLLRTGAGPALALPEVQVAQGWLWRWGEFASQLVLALAGIALLVILNSRRLNNADEHAPVVYRPPVDPLARHFVFFFAIAPGLLFSLVSALLGIRLLGGNGTLLLMSGLAVVVAGSDLIYFRRQRFLRTLWLWIIAAPALFVLGMTLAQPWIVGTEVKTMFPARDIGEFFGDSFQRRTGQPLGAVAGDPQLASLISFAAPGRPRLLLDAAPELTPWLTLDKFKQSGGVVVWRAADTAGTPPDDIARRFPGLVPEVPRSFQRYLTGRQPLLRVGWAIVRPQQQAVSAK